MRAPIIPTPPNNRRASRSHSLASIEYYATGRRKTSTARVFLRPGTGSITVNHRPFDKYFLTEDDRQSALAPLLSLIHI